MCDSSNCMHCQVHAQRFRHIVSHAFHGSRLCECDGGVGGSQGSSPGGPGLPKRKVTVSSIWDFDREAMVGDRKMASNLGPASNHGVSLMGTFHGTPGLGEHEIVSGLEWEPSHGCLLATAGVSKQVRIYSMATLLSDWEDESTRRDPVRLYRLASKLTNLAWHPARSGILTVGDYDGCVTEMDLETGHILYEGDEHAGRRVWSVSYTQSGCLASGSEDGTVAFWDAHVDSRNHGGVVSRIMTPGAGTKTPVTGVDVSRWNPNLIGLSSADSCGYVYDMRNLASPVRTLRGHTKPASYIKFYDQNTVVTAGIDSSLISWDLTAARGSERKVTFAAHNNNKHFVGLSVLPEEGLVSCGSETGRVFCYEQGHGRVVASYVSSDIGKGSDVDDDVDDAGGARGRQRSNSGVFCSAVAWRPAHRLDGQGPVIAAALSDASISLCRLSKRKELD